MSAVAPIPSGSPVGSGARGVIKQHRTEARSINLDILAAHEMNAASVLREAEDAVVAAGKAEAEREALYDQPRQDLAAKYSVGGESHV